MTAAINSTGAGKRGYPTKSSVPYTQASTQRRARERSVAIQTLLLVRKSKSSSRSEERFSRNAETDLVCRLLLEKKKATTECPTVLAATLPAPHQLHAVPQFLQVRQGA